MSLLSGVATPMQEDYRLTRRGLLLAATGAHVLAFGCRDSRLPTEPIAEPPQPISRPEISCRVQRRFCPGEEFVAEARVTCRGVKAQGNVASTIGSGYPILAVELLDFAGGEAIFISGWNWWVVDRRAPGGDVTQSLTVRMVVAKGIRPGVEAGMVYGGPYDSELGTPFWRYERIKFFVKPAGACEIGEGTREVDQASGSGPNPALQRTRVRSPLNATR